MMAIYTHVLACTGRKGQRNAACHPYPRRGAPALTLLAACAQVFELNHTRAWLAVLTSICAMAASLYLIAISPWYLLPFAWALAGTAFTGFFVVGHDAGHRCAAGTGHWRPFSAACGRRRPTAFETLATGLRTAAAPRRPCVSLQLGHPLRPVPRLARCSSPVALQPAC